MKDQADVMDMPTTMGSVLLRDHMPQRDCFVAAKLKTAGALFIAKTTLGELGADDTHGSLFGLPVVLMILIGLQAVHRVDLVLRHRQIFALPPLVRKG